MHESVLLSGAEIDFWIHARWLDWDVYAELVNPVIKATGADIQANSDAKRIGEIIWSQIRELKTRTLPESNAFVRCSINGFHAAYSNWRLKHQSRRLKTISPALPLESASVGWELIRQAARKDGVVEYLFWGLGILGWVSTIYSDMKVCRYCFRWSVPGSPFCFLHSQSKSIAGDVGHAYSRNRAGGRVFKAARHMNMEVRQAFSAIDDVYQRTVLAEFLFFNTLSEEEGVELRRALLDAPHVLTALGGKRILSLVNNKLFDLVRNRINPMELFPISLIYNVMLAERLMNIEAQRKAGRPKGKRNESSNVMLEKAIELFKLGNRPVDVALILGVSRSAVSNWIGRYDEVRCAYEKYDNSQR